MCIWDITLCVYKFFDKLYRNKKNTINFLFLLLLLLLWNAFDINLYMNFCCCCKMNLFCCWVFFYSHLNVLSVCYLLRWYTFKYSIFCYFLLLVFKMFVSLDQLFFSKINIYILILIGLSLNIWRYISFFLDLHVGWYVYLLFVSSFYNGITLHWNYW